MGAYSEVYLQEIVETQGDLFENIRDYVPGIDVRNFIEVYMSGKTRSLGWTPPDHRMARAESSGIRTDGSAVAAG